MEITGPREIPLNNDKKSKTIFYRKTIRNFVCLFVYKYRDRNIVDKKQNSRNHNETTNTMFFEVPCRSISKFL